MDENQNKNHLIGKPCRGCGHPAGAHSSLQELDLDDPGSENRECSMDDCSCGEFRTE